MSGRKGSNIKRVNWNEDMDERLLAAIQNTPVTGRAPRGYWTMIAKRVGRRVEGRHCRTRASYLEGAGVLAANEEAPPPAEIEKRLAHVEDLLTQILDVLTRPVEPEKTADVIQLSGSASATH